MEAGRPGRVMANWFRSFGPAFLVAVGFMDPGNWLTLVEGGSSFGFELLWVVAVSTVFAMLLQTISARVGEMTGKDFAQVCRQEFPSGVCVFLWGLCEVSILAVDMTMILGTAIGLNVLLRISFLPSLFSMVVDALLFTMLLPLLETRGTLYITGMAIGIVLPSFVLENDFIGAHPVPIIEGLVPKLRHETLYVAVCIVGANVVPQNFYLHSSLVKKQSQHNLSWSALSHYDFLGTLFPFCAVLVVKTAVLSATAIGSHNAGLVVFTLDDAQALIEQMLNDSICPQLFGLAVLYAGQISRLNGASTGEIISEGFFDWKIPPRKHWAVIRGIALLSVVSCTWCYGSEGAYRMLLFCQVFLALHLPFTVIPLIKITSSERIMGSFKNSFFLETFSWLLLAALTCVGVTLVFDIVVGEFEDNASLKGFEYLVRNGWRMEMGEENFQFAAFAVISIVITLVLSYLVWLVFVPLRLDTTTVSRREDHAKPATYVEQNEPVAMEAGSDWPFIDSLPSNFGPESKDDEEGKVEPYISIELPQLKATIEVSDLSAPAEVHEDARLDSLKSCEDDAFQERVSTSKSPLDVENPVAASQGEISNRSLGKVDVTSAEVKEAAALENAEAGAKADADGCVTGKDDAVERSESLKQEGVPRGATTSNANLNVRAIQGDGHESGKGDTGVANDGESGSGSLSRLSGLGRAARRQFALILDEFWATLYDLHGQPLPPGSSDLPGKGNQPDGNIAVMSGSYERTDGQKVGPKQKSSFKRPNVVNYQSRDTEAYMLRAFTQAAASTPSQLSSTQYQGYGASLNYASPSDRNDPSLRPPSHLGDNDYQSSTMQGYRTLSLAARNGNVAGGLNARSSHLNVPVVGSRSSAGPEVDSDVAAVYRNTWEDHSGQTILSSQWVSNVVGGRSLFQGKHIGDSENSNFSSHQWDPLVYKSTNISLGRWNPLVYRATGELDMKNNRPALPPDSGQQVNFGHSPIGRRGQGDNVESAPPLVFDELSPSQSHRDAFSIQTSALPPETQSLWSRQPFERLFGPPEADYLPFHASRLGRSGSGGLESPSIGSPTSGGTLIELEALGRLQECVGKLTRLDGAEWLFHLGDGEDEDLIAAIAAMQKSSAHVEKQDLYREISTHERHLMETYGWSQGGRAARDSFLSRRLQSSVPHCGTGCVWEGSLLVSFGVWCMRRTLELSLLESRPELWGKYTYVLNRLQGILEPAFSKPLLRRFHCRCVGDRTLLDIGMRRIFSNRQGGADSLTHLCWSWGQKTSSKGKCLTAATLVELIRDVESAVANRKGRTGTAAGDVAFPKGKENLASVLKRYKRRLSGKPLGSTGVGGGGRRV